MPLAHTWAGQLFGTHVGNLSAKLSGEDDSLAGVLRYANPAGGIHVYDIAGSFDGANLILNGTIKQAATDVQVPPINVTATLQADGSLRGDWQTPIGAGGNLVLWPHDGSRSMPADVTLPDQIHTTRHQLGPVAIELSDIIAVADDIQKELPRARVVVTFDTGTEQSRYLADFKTLSFTKERATLLKIHGTEPDPSGIDRVLSVEFGQHVNFIMAQSVSRSWSLGALENLRQIVEQHERSYANPKFGLGINQFILFGTIVALPSMDTLMQRAILMAIAVTVTLSLNKLHSRYMPNAAIYLGERREGTLHNAFQSLGIWAIGAIGSIVVVLAGAYLKGLLRL